MNNSSKGNSRRSGDSGLPLSDSNFLSLFEHLADQLKRESCDNSLRMTQAWLGANEHPVEPTRRWLEDHGGFCDCEVILNAFERWKVHRARPRLLRLK